MPRKLLITTQTVDRDDPILGFFHGWILEFSRHFDRIDVICLKEGEHNLPQNVYIHSLGKEKGENRLKYLFRFYTNFTWIFFSRVDVVFFHMGAIFNVLAFPFFLIRKLFRTKFFWWKTHGKVDALKERLALRGVDLVFTAGAKSFDVPTEKVRVVGHAIDTELFAFPETRDHLVKSLIMVGRIVPIKKIEVALRAVAIVEKDMDGITLDLYGGPDTRAYEESLRSLATTLTLSGVSFQGPRKQREMPSLLKRAGILLHPAYEAGFDKAVLEAMATGVIPLTSIPSFKPILAPYDLFVEREDYEGYGMRILRIIRMSEHEREGLRGELRKIVERDHSLTTLPGRIFGL